MTKKKFWTSDRVVSVAAMFISVITLFIFIKQTNIMERQSKLSALPYLMLDISFNNYDKQIRLDLVNHGLGPAIIEEVIIHYNGKDYEMQLFDFLQEHQPTIDSVNVTNITTIDRGLAIPSEQLVTLLAGGGTNKQYTYFVEIMEFLQSDEFDFTIAYKSVYNDRWKINSKSEEPIRID